jgi:cephalosporin hydroxylase
MTDTDWTHIRAERYEAARTPWSDIQGHLPTLVGLVIETKARIVIELGVRWGTSTVAWLYALGKTHPNDGRLWSVDTKDNYRTDDPLWSFIEGHDCDPDVVCQLPNGTDIVFVDTDHRYDLTLQEIDLYRSKVRAGGLMVFHDTEGESFEHHHPGTQPPFPVMKAINDRFPHDKFKRQHYSGFNGLTVVKL